MKTGKRRGEDLIARAAMVLLIATLAVSASLAGDEEESYLRPFTLEDYYRLARPDGLDLSPDGEWLAYSLKTTNLPRAASNRDLHLVSATGDVHRQLTFTEDVSESEPTFSPDGKLVAFVAKRGEQESAQIWLLPFGGGEARPLTEFHMGVSDLVWSPDGAHIAFTSEVYPRCGADDACNRKESERQATGRIGAHVADELLHRHWKAWLDGKVTHIFLANVETGEIRDATPGERQAPAHSLGDGLGFAFSPDGKELCFTRNPDPIETLAWSTNSDLWVLSLESADALPRNITPRNLAWDGRPVYSPDGRHIAYIRQSRPGFEADLFQLGLHDRESGENRVLAPEHPNWVTDVAWVGNSKDLVFRSEFQMRTPLNIVRTTIGRIRRAIDEGHIHEYVVSDDGHWAYGIRSTIGMPHEVWRFDLYGQESSMRLTQHNFAIQSEVEIRPGQDLWLRREDGREIHVMLIKPYNFDVEKKYPVILNVHGGPQGQWTNSFRGDWQMYTGSGYVVVFVNPTGSTGYGQDYTSAISKDWGGEIFDELMYVVDFLSKYAYVDTDRVGAMGWSYGGYMMNWLQAKTDRFAALACMMGIFDLRSFYLSTEELWFPEWDFGGPSWESELYEKWSPSNYVENFKTPELFITGEMDFRVPYTQSLMGFTALRRKGIPAKLIVMPKAGHWPDWYEMALYYTAHIEWFHDYLGGDPPPWSVEDFANNTVFDPDTGTRMDLDE